MAAKHLPLALHKIIEFGLGNTTWQQFVDHYNEIYDTFNVAGFEFAPTRIDYTYSQLIASTGATTLPAYVDPESPGYEKALEALAGATGNIPTMKAFYSLNRVTLRQKMQLIDKFGDAALTSEMRSVLLGMLDESTDGLIKSYYNALTHQRMRIVSTGQFVIDINNNPRGLRGITLDFNIDSDHFDTLTGQDRWWTNANHTTEGTNSDPIQYIKDRYNKFIVNQKHSYGPMHLEISDALWRDMLEHSKVLTRVGYRLNVLISSDANAIAAAKNLDDEELKRQIERLIGLRIVVNNSKAWVDKPNATTHTVEQIEVENFDSKNIAFLPDGKIGDIQGVEPLSLGYEADKVARYNGGRLLLTQRAIPETHSIYIESEAAQLCVPGAVRNMYISTVTA